VSRKLGAIHRQFAKVVPRVVGTGIRDVIEDGDEDIHVGNGLQKGDPHPRIHPDQDRKTPQIPSTIPLMRVVGQFWIKFKNQKRLIYSRNRSGYFWY
tara:strand:- start:117 stop:407 length:291 start_codon:yes stop_codon:yes gene_type:complete